MDKPKRPADKLPYIDPMQPKIYDILIATAEQVRKDRKTDEYRQAERRRELAAITLRELRERERMEVEAELYRQQQASKDQTFIPFQPGRPFLSLREVPPAS